MPSNRSLLKVFGIASILLGVLNLAIIFGGAQPVYAYIIAGVFGILLGISLLLAAKDPTKAGFATVLAWIDLILNALGFALPLVEGKFSLYALAEVLLSIVVVLALRSLKKT